MSVAVRLEGITKRFPGVLANDRIDLVVEAGEIHAIWRRERRRQVDADEDPLRDAASR